MELRLATEQNGVAGLHLEAIAEVCRKRNCFLFIRPSEPATVRLIKLGFATKSMDVHDKSSDWGLTSGLVPCDQAFSKKLVGTPNPDISPHAHGEAKPVKLVFSVAQFASLWGAKHFELTTEIPMNGQCFTQAESATHRHFHSTKNTNVCFMWSKIDGSVTWKQRQARGTATSVWVWGYNGVPVTGDYDMWMVAPHYQDIKRSGLDTVLSMPDQHGRSAAQRFTKMLADELNAACMPKYPRGQRVFNHGAEAQNLSFTQQMESKHLVVFAAGRHDPFLIHAISEPLKLTSLFHDLLRHGYVIMRNPKWMHGFTLNTEDLAFVPDELLLDASESERAVVTKKVTESKQAVANLQNGAATTIQRAVRARQAEKANATPPAPTKVGSDWQSTFKARAKLLREFRRVANIPDDQGQDLIAPKELFPYWNQTSLKTDLVSRTIGQSQESHFGRTGYLLEGEAGHRDVVPVDRSRK